MSFTTFTGETTVCVHGLPGDGKARMMLALSAGSVIEIEMHNCDFSWRGEREVKTVLFRASHFETDAAGIRHYRVLSPRGV